MDYGYLTDIHDSTLAVLLFNIYLFILNIKNND